MNKNDIRFLICNNLYLSNGLDNTVFEQTDSGYLLHLNLFDTLKLCPFLVLRSLSSIYFAKTTYYRKLSSIIKRERPRRTKIVCHSKKTKLFYSPCKLEAFSLLHEASPPVNQFINAKNNSRKFALSLIGMVLLISKICISNHSAVSRKLFSWAIFPGGAANVTFAILSCTRVHAKY